MTYDPRLTPTKRTIRYNKVMDWCRTSYVISRKSAFTLIELLLFAAIFVVIMIAFITMFVTITRVGTTQTAAAEVNQQGDFLLRQLQYYIEQSSLVELNQDAVTSTLKLRMAASSTDPTRIYLSGNMVYLQQTDGGTPFPLTSSKVNVTSLTFTKRSNPPALDAVSIAFSVAYNTSNTQQQFSRNLNTTIARVNAATFDANVLPTSTATYKLGANGQVWASVNDIIYFSGSSTGIGIASPGQTLEVNGGMRLNTVTATSTCTSALRGTLWVTQNAAGKQDSVVVCAKQASGDTYDWRTIY